MTFRRFKLNTLAALGRLQAILYKELLYIARDRKLILIILLVPIIQALLLGYAINMDIKNIRLAFIDNSNSEISRTFINSFYSSKTFQYVPSDNSVEKAEKMLLANEISIYILIPKDFEKKIYNAERSPVQVVLDGSNSVNAGIIATYVGSIISRFNSKLASPNAFLGVGLEYRTLFNETLESKNFFVPSMLAMLLIIVTVMLSSIAIVQEIEAGTMDQLIVSPLSVSEFIISKSIPFAIVSFLDVILIILISIAWFDVPLKGSLLLLLGSSMLYILCTLGIGFLISAVSSTQQQASIGVFLIIFPLILLSGLAFPIDNMPEAMQYVTYINPMRHYLDIVIGVFMKGLDITSLFKEVMALVLLTIIYTIPTSILLYKKLK